MSRTSVIYLIGGLLVLLMALGSLDETSLAQVQTTVELYLPVVFRQHEITPTITFTPAPRPSRTPTRTATFTPFPTWTPFRTWTPVPTPTITPTSTLTPTQTFTPTNTSTPTYIPLPSFTLIFPSPTSTQTVSYSQTPTLTATGEAYPYASPGTGSERAGLIFLVGSLWVLLAGWLVLLLRKARQ